MAAPFWRNSGNLPAVGRKVRPTIGPVIAVWSPFRILKMTAAGEQKVVVATEQRRVKAVASHCAEAG